MPKWETTRRVGSSVIPGVFFVIRKMTEGRREELRKQIGPAIRRMRAILTEQDNLSSSTAPDRSEKYIELQDEFETLQAEKIDHAYIGWGVKQILGLEIDDRVLDVSDFKDWPSELYAEVLAIVRAEAELNGAERKNSESPTTSGAQEGGNLKLSIVGNAEKEDTGDKETVESTLLPM